MAQARATDQPPLSRVSDYVTRWAVARGTTDALTVDERRLTYGRLAEEVDRLARALLAVGVSKGDRVATLQTPHPDSVTAFLATASIGAIWVGLNPKYRAEELAYAVGDADPKILLTRTAIDGRSYGGEVEALCRVAPELSHVVTFEGDPPCRGAARMSEFLALGDDLAEDKLAMARAETGGRDPCLIVYTSGSTGRPKGALLHHEGIIGFALAQNALWSVEPYRAVNYFPINHIGSVVDVTVPALVAGGTLHFMELFDPAKCLELMERERATIWGSVPAALLMQLALPDFGGRDLSSLQLIVWEGAPMPAEGVRALALVCPRLATNYGMTETTSAITALEPTADLEILTGSVGHALADLEIRLVRPDGSDIEDGEPGEVLVRGRRVFLGYWRRPAETADAFTPNGWFRTGDLAVRRPDGALRLVGRLKEMYKSGGYNVYPREVETALESHPAVALAAVVGVPDPLWDEVGVAFVVSAAEVDTTALEAWCRERLANYKVPKRIVITADVPLLPIGKVDKAALKRLATELD